MIVLHHPTKRDLGITVNEGTDKAPEGYYVQTKADDGEGNRCFVGPFPAYDHAVRGRAEYRRVERAIDKASTELNRVENSFGEGGLADGRRRERVAELHKVIDEGHYTLQNIVILTKSTPAE